MCGIIGCVGDTDVLDRLVGGLERLEYRGYDSAGVATGPDSLAVYKRAGQVSDLADELVGGLSNGTAGIGHTRWSTHGPPTDANAHPHTDCHDEVAVVHNGVIENYDALREELQERGHRFESDTDTEVIPHLIEERLAAGSSSVGAIREAVDQLDGSYAIAVMIEGVDGLLAARNGSPLAVGVDDGIRYLASDVPAFLEYTDHVTYLQNGDVAVLRDGDHRVTNGDGEPVERPTQSIDWIAEDARKQDHDHFMKKEIEEQPVAVEETIEGRIGPDGEVDLDELPDDVFEGVERVQFVGCGTSYHAALYGRQLLIARGMPATVALASEYASTPPPVEDGTLVVGVTQSGETADTLAALRSASDRGARTLALTNVPDSTAARECDDALYIRAGPEIGVAATKTFLAQLSVLVLLVERLCGPDDESADRLQALSRLPDHVEEVLTSSRPVALSQKYRDSDAYFFIGRGVAHPVALEGALKLKEISYEHAEGFPAGELKHGPLALVTSETPVIAVLSGRQDEETLTSVEEVRARGAPVIAVTSRTDVDGLVDDVLQIPDTHPDIGPALANVHLQAFSYHLAALLDRSIDKPRNLAKSVTVE